MKNMTDASVFINEIKKQFLSKQLIQIALHKSATDLVAKSIYARPITLRDEFFLSFTFRFDTRDEIKNLTLPAAVDFLYENLGTNFLQATLFSTKNDVTILYSKKGKTTILTKKATQLMPTTALHNRAKEHLTLSAAQRYLPALGITNLQGEMLPTGQKKYRQIQKYLEIIASLLREHPLPPQPIIADMGCGKGYLTFALFDFLQNNLQLQPYLTGIELRQNLVEFCTKLNENTGFERLNFVAQDIKDFQPPRLDVLIALHACDTATDLALAKGIRAGAEIIVVAPCCHKQIRKEINIEPSSIFSPIFSHGILAERQAELLTDAIRSLLLEANGYRTKVFEFIAAEHTAKNLMITAIKTDYKNQKAMSQITAIKQQFGIKTHALEAMLES